VLRSVRLCMHSYAETCVGLQAMLELRMHTVVYSRLVNIESLYDDLY
jgi:hypothetical protein